MTKVLDEPIVAVVIPLFAHSVLVADALESALSQRCGFSFCIVVVNDGCPFQESALQVKSIQTVRPDVVHYVVQPNRGLSAARNTGIDYALAHFPSLQAIYFLDSDNAILPGALEAAWSSLQANPGTSWIYPNIDMFGITRNFDYRGDYSVFRHAFYNICEAGSMVHRRVFDAGIRFDETMKSGYEDWDFWLTAAEKGFRGAHHPHFGFRYRNRGESMLSQAHRDDKEIRSELRRKHASLIGQRGLMRLETLESPRYAILFTDTNEGMLTSGHAYSATAISHVEIDERLWRNIVFPGGQGLPPFFVFMTHAAWILMSQTGLILWVLYHFEVTLKDMAISSIVIHSDQGEAFEIRGGGKIANSDVLAIRLDTLRAVIREADTSWIEGLLSPGESKGVSTETLALPHTAGLSAEPKGTVALAFLVKIRSWRASRYRFAASRAWIWRDLSVPPLDALYLKVQEAFGGEVDYPSASPATRNIGFILPIASFGGVERVAYNLAQQFCSAGWQVHLYVIGQSRIEVPAEFRSSIASINFLQDPAFGAWDPETEYQGTALSASRKHPRAVNRLVAALAWLDVVVNCHTGEFNAAAAQLRRIGVRTVSHLHILDLSPYGRSVGHPILALAYEHAYDLIVCNSRQLAAWMHAAGIPAEKLLLVPNAPGHPLDQATRESILAERAERQESPKLSLNALYLGRLDRQKGIDRLAEVVRQTRELDLPVEWRIVGSAITGQETLPPILQGLREPPVFDGQSLTALFAWADVMVLLSEFEGVPLSVLEAQRLGVVVIATNVGALSEIVSNGKNGFLVETDTAIEQAVALLRLFAEVPELRSAVASNAASQVIEWPQAARALIARIDAMVDAERLARPPYLDPFRSAASGEVASAVSITQ
jgi:glycosyltransferase involved in cell wall biosynthesis